MCTYVYGDCACYAFLCVWCVCVCVRVYVRQTARDGDLFEQTLDAFAPLRPSHSCVCGVLIYMAFAPVMHFCVCVVCVCVCERVIVCVRKRACGMGIFSEQTQEAFAPLCPSYTSMCVMCMCVRERERV